MPYLKRKDLIFIIFLILWFICSKDFFVSQIISIKDSFRLLPLSLEQKYRLIDGPLYNYVNFLRTKIPEDTNVIFINMSKDLKERTRAWVKSEYDRARLHYYLYPRKLILTNSGYSGREAYRIVYTVTPAYAVLDLYCPGQEIDDTH